MRGEQAPVAKWDTAVHSTEKEMAFDFSDRYALIFRRYVPYARIKGT